LLQSINPKTKDNRSFFLTFTFFYEKINLVFNELNLSQLDQNYEKAIKDFLLTCPPFSNEKSWQQSIRNGLTKGLHFIDNNQFYGSLFTEVVGCNIPKVLMVASEKERHEQFIMQFLNTSVIWGGGSLYDKFLEKALFKPSKHYDNMMKGIGDVGRIQDAKEWHAIGKTAGMFGLIAPWMFTLPCLRNAFTVWQSGATNFAQMSGLQAYDRKDPKHQAEEHKALKKNLSIFAIANVGGLALGLVGAVAARRGMDAAMEGKALSKGLKGFRNAVRGFDANFKDWPLVGSQEPKNSKAYQDDSILFKDGKFSNFAGLPLVVSWILPGYLGYLAFIRDPLEAFEAVLGTAVALFSFEAGPKALRGTIEMAMKNNPNNRLVRGAIKNFGSVENTGQLSKMLISTTLYGMLPTGLSLVTRPFRAKKAGIHKSETESTPSSCNTTQNVENNNRQPDITEDGMPNLFSNFQYTTSPSGQGRYDQSPLLKTFHPRRSGAFPHMTQYQHITQHLKTTSV
jgi:hypothetical protein